MSYRFPIYVGDRVALAPHLDLWMAGLRYGEVTDIMVNGEGVRWYHVKCNLSTSFWAHGDDLLGATTSTYQPRHRRVVGVFNDEHDPASQSRCAMFGQRKCTWAYCPRHKPDSYADAMGKHATDSI